MRLTDKVIIVTGGASGIGKCFCEHLLSEGARLIIADINSDEASRVANTLNQENPQGNAVLPLQVDVTDEVSVAKMVEATLDQYQRIDVLINNVGSYPHVDFENITYEKWRQVLAINLDSVVLCTKAVLPVMKGQQSGKIINIASNLIWIGLAGMVHYVTAKAGLIGFTRSLAREVGDFNITVNALAPGAIIPSRELLNEASLSRVESILSHQSVKWCQRPLDLVGSILFLSSSDSDFMSGQILTVDGGLTNH